jgi:hypothetical protein
MRTWPSVDGNTPDDVVRRLNILMSKLEADGNHVSANTAYLAREMIQLLAAGPRASPETTERQQQKQHLRAQIDDINARLNETPWGIQDEVELEKERAVLRERLGRLTSELARLE